MQINFITEKARACARQHPDWNIKENVLCCQGQSYMEVISSLFEFGCDIFRDFRTY